MPTLFQNDRLQLIPNIILASLSVLVSGCVEPEEVHVSKVDPSRSALDNEAFVAGLNQASSVGTEASGESFRMIAAMIDRPEQTYFLKALASAKKIEAIQPELEKLIQSLRFNENGKPIAWTTPEGWKEADGGAMFRLATLTAPNGTEVTVTSLTPGQELLPNLNRWQGQLNLPPLSKDQIQVQRFNVGKQEVILYDQTGTGGSTSMAPPFAAQAQPPAADAPSTGSGSSDAQPASNDTPTVATLPFKIPALSDDWSPLEPTASKVVRWEKDTDKGKLQFELLRFPIDAPFAAMVGVWGSSIGVEVTEADTFQDFLQPVDIGTQTAKWLVIPNEQMPRADGADSNLAIRVARLDIGNDAWYFKWQGPESSIVEMKEESIELLKNVQSAHSDQ